MHFSKRIFKTFRATVFLLLLTTLAQSAFAQDGTEGWPRLYTAEDTEIIVYQPQIESWDTYTVMKATSAVKVTRIKADKIFYGAIYLQANTTTNTDTRIVLFKDIKIIDIQFPDVPENDAKSNAALIHSTITPKTNIPMALDRIIAALEYSDLQTKEIKVNLEPPPIYYSYKPAILVMFIGEPTFKPIEGTDIFFATNTNWDILLDSNTKVYFLLHGDTWFKSLTPTSNTWEMTVSLPKSFDQLPKDDNWKNVNEHIPGIKGPITPNIFVSITPAELIVTDGPVEMVMIAQTDLFYIKNTESILFYHIGDKHYYFLTSGRWFKSDTLANATWQAASSDLPKDFLKIPQDHPKEFVLSSVPGSPEAKAAILQASIPQKVEVNRKTATVEVTYEGDPKFVEIENTKVVYAVNTPSSVFLVNHKYYCCHQGIWFDAYAATGPWTVCTKVPDDIYTIPSTHPMHNVTYVYIYDSSPDVVYVGYTSGYTGSYVAATGVLMFGLGYIIASDDDHYHHHYHPHYYAYGCGAHYDYHHGSYYRSASVYGPYGGAGRAASYNASTGTYARGAYRYGPSGGAYAAQAYNPYTDRYAAKAGATTPYGSWGRSVVADGNDWARTGHKSNYKGRVVGGQNSEGGAFISGKNKQTGNRGGIGRDEDGNLYVGNNGNIYKKDNDGQWQKNSNGSWEDFERNNIQTTQNRDQSKNDFSNQRNTNLNDQAVSTNDRVNSQKATQNDRGQRQSYDRSRQDTVSQLNREQNFRDTGNRRTRNAQRARSTRGRGR